MYKVRIGPVSVPPTQTSMEQGSWVEYHPLTTVRDGGPIEFEISGSGEDYTSQTTSTAQVVTLLTWMPSTMMCVRPVVSVVYAT